MKLKVDRSYKKPKWEEVGAHSFADYLEKIGAKYILVTGGIGHTGEKIHAIFLEYLDTGNGIYPLSATSLCGSGTQMSSRYPYYETDLSGVNCKKCKEHMEKSKKREKAYDINEAIKRSATAKNKGAKAKLLGDGTIEYSVLRKSGAGRSYRAKATFSEILPLLWGEDMRALKKKYGR